MSDVWLPWPHALEKIDDGGRTPREAAKRFAAARLDRLRTHDAVGRKMTHQTEKERQVVDGDALFIERQEKRSGGGVQQIVGVLDAFGDALVGQYLADIVGFQKICKLLGGDVGVDRHLVSPFRSRSCYSVFKRGGYRLA